MALDSLTPAPAALEGLTFLEASTARQSLELQLPRYDVVILPEPKGGVSVCLLQEDSWAGLAKLLRASGRIAVVDIQHDGLGATGVYAGLDAAVVALVLAFGGSGTPWAH